MQLNNVIKVLDTCNLTDTAKNSTDTNAGIGIGALLIATHTNLISSGFMLQCISNKLFKHYY